MCTLCVRFVLALLFKGLLPVTVTFAHSKFTFAKKCMHQLTLTVSEKIIFKMLKIDGTRQLKLQANMKWHWRCNDDDKRDKKTHAHTHSP